MLALGCGAPASTPVAAAKAEEIAAPSPAPEPKVARAAKAPSPAPPVTPFARGDVAAVRSAFAAATGRELGERDCVEWPESFPSVVVVGAFADDRGCELDGIFVVRTYHATHGELAGLGTRGFADGPMDEKERVAAAWVDEVVHAFGGGFVKEATPAFGRAGRPAYAPVRARLDKVGGVVVEGWVEEPAGMTDSRTFSFVVHRFGREGELEVEVRNSFTVDGEKLRAAKAAKPG
jgi:hypothetical protein